MQIKLNDSGFDITIDRLKKAGIFVGDKATRNAIAELAAKSRRKADKALRGVLDMGQPQKKGREEEKVRSVYSESSGAWVTARGNWKLSRFTWETTRAMKRNGEIKTSAYAKARYTSTIANLWENDTKPYSEKSPVISKKGISLVLQKGEVRKGKHFWRSVEAIFAATVPEALHETERKLVEEFKKV